MYLKLLPIPDVSGYQLQNQRLPLVFSSLDGGS